MYIFIICTTPLLLMAVKNICTIKHRCAGVVTWSQRLSTTPFAPTTTSADAQMLVKIKHQDQGFLKIHNQISFNLRR